MFGLSRLGTVARVLISRTSRTPVITTLRSSADASHEWVYRVPKTKHPKINMIMSEGIMAVMWYWVMFHCWYDYEHLIGHYDYPDPSKWTDAELGIPPLDE